MNLVANLRKAATILLSLVASIVLVLGFSIVSDSAPAIAGYDPFIGEIELLPYSYCPEGFLEANGQTLQISQNQALFSLLGTTFGGNGTTTFNLPDLSGRFPMGIGRTADRNIVLGQQAGSATVTLNVNSLPAHNHGYATSTVAAANATAEAGAGTVTVVKSITANAGNATTANTGNGQPVSIIPPYVGMRYCIATQGIYPSRP
jgi:microcystin-dependent protein